MHSPTVATAARNMSYFKPNVRSRWVWFQCCCSLIDCSGLEHVPIPCVPRVIVAMFAHCLQINVLFARAQVLYDPATVVPLMSSLLVHDVRGRTLSVCELSACLWPILTSQLDRACSPPSERRIATPTDDHLRASVAGRHVDHSLQRRHDRARRIPYERGAALGFVCARSNYVCLICVFLVWNCWIEVCGGCGDYVVGCASLTQATKQKQKGQIDAQFEAR